MLGAGLRLRGACEREGPWDLRARGTGWVLCAPTCVWFSSPPQSPFFHVCGS